MFLLAGLAPGGIGFGAVLEGVVVENATGRPLARARVTLEALEGGSSEGVPDILTSSSGQFRYPRLAPGTYRLSARKRGYATTRYGQRGWDHPGTPIVLQAAGAFVAELRLPRAGLITGAVTDENGVPLPGQAVNAFRLDKRLVMVASAETDDRGVYRLIHLTPGNYYVRSNSAVLEDGRALLPTYFGQSATFHDARPVQVRLDQETTEINIEPVTGRLATLRGRVTGGPARSLVLLTDIGRLEAALAADGSFSFSGLPPGPYELLAEGGDGGEPLAAWQKVHLDGSDFHVGLELSPPPSMRVACREKMDRPFSAKLILLSLRRGDFPGEPTRMVHCGETLRLSPGEWSFSLSGPPGSYIARVEGARAAAAAFEFPVRPRQDHEVFIELSAQPAAVRGAVANAAGEAAIGAPVFLRAADAELALRAGGIRRAQTDEQGRYRFDGLAPGRYEIVASFELRSPEQYWPEGLGKTFAVQEGDEAALDVDLLQIQ